MKSPKLDQIQATSESLRPYVVETPVWHWRGREIGNLTGSITEVYLKLELFQHTGTFKPRGALSNMLHLGREKLERGVTAVSAGNHAIAVAYAAQVVGSSAKVVMPRTSNPARVALCRAYGGDVVLVGDVHEAFERTHQIERDEGRTFVHPYEGLRTVLGTATVGWELAHQLPALDAVIVPIGGGGLIAGIASAVKQLQPQCKIHGVEPEGADKMFRSFASGKPESIDRVNTIADSLGPPHVTPNTFAICQQYVDDIVLISDEAMRRAMLLLFESAKLAVEPAGAAATAALTGPLLEKVRGKRVAVIVCGSNIDVQTFASHIAAIDALGD